MSKNTLAIIALKDEIKHYLDGERVCFSGVGKVNASYTVTKEIYKNRPNLVVNLGTAGSKFFKRGSVINCTKFVQRDMDVTPLGFSNFVTPFEENEQILEYGLRLRHLEEGVCGSGDSFDISNKTEIYNLVDMEAFAIAKICKSEKIPFICVKYITDGADDGAALDWEKALKDAAEKLSVEYNFVTRND